jgi:hypothetical protein
MGREVYRFLREITTRLVLRQKALAAVQSVQLRLGETGERKTGRRVLQ